MNTELNHDYDYEPICRWDEHEDTRLQLIYDEQHSPTAWEPINEPN